MKHYLEVVQTIRKLRDPKIGCPWDLKQTHQSLLKYLIEEAYEFIEAVEEQNTDHMQDELGDVLLQVLLHSQIAAEAGHFDIESVAKSLNEKMIRRHPHVFEAAGKLTAEEVTQNWEKIKNLEKGDRPKTYFQSKDLNRPPLAAAHRIGAKSAKVSFDWSSIEEVFAKVEEELLEVKEEIIAGNHEKLQEEIGDLLFSVAQLARHTGGDSSTILHNANKKFLRRFTALEGLAIERQIDILDSKTEVLESLWNEVKKSES